MPAIEHEVVVPSAFAVAGTLCLPAGAGDRRRVPAFALLGGSGAFGRDGDIVPACDGEGPLPGTLRSVAHRLADAGIASLRWDRRGFGASGGDHSRADYATDLEDALAAVTWLRHHPVVDGERVAVLGHSAGALTACHVCRDAPWIAGTALLGALASPIEDLLVRNRHRMLAVWPLLSEGERAGVLRRTPAALVLAEGADRVLLAARRGEEVVRIESGEEVLELRTARARQDLATDYEAEFHHVRCPVLVLHGGEDRNVAVEDALVAYAALRRAGNDAVDLVVVPGLEHYFHPVASSPAQRDIERVTLAAFQRPMSPLALEVLAGWAVRTLAGPLDVPDATGNYSRT